MIKVYLLLLIAFLSQTGFSQTLTPSTVRQIYNFEVGDTFEYAVNTYSLDGQYGCNLQGHEMRIILSKTEYPDLLIYSYRENNTGSWNCNYQYGGIDSWSDTTQLTIAQLDSTIFWYHTYHSQGCDSNNSCYMDTVYIDSSMNSLKINEHFEGNYTWDVLDTAYADGVGVIKGVYEYEDQEQPQGNEYLIYYHKANGDSWGDLYAFTIAGINNVNEESSIDLFPNPTTSSFQLRLSESPSQPIYFSLYDALGRQVKQERVTEVNSIFQRNNLNNGVYFWELESENRVMRRGKLVLE